MANEAVIIELPRNINPIMRTCADGTTIEKGTLLKLSGANIVISSPLNSQAFGGIAAAEKTASDGSTQIPVYMNGCFDLLVATGSAGVTCGAAVTMSGANAVRLGVEADYPLGAVVGYAEEVGAAGDVIRVRLRGG